MALAGALRKMAVEWRKDAPVLYRLRLDDRSYLLNESLGKTVRFTFQGEIHCVHCGSRTPKSYSQGHCFKHARSLAACDLCIVRPETCHHHLGTCREPEWGTEHCMIPHTVYVANTSGLKVGITRSGQRVTRWIDQGAVRARPLFEVRTRLDAGRVEKALSQLVSDRTDWRAMLRGSVPIVDLGSAAADLRRAVPEGIETMPFATDEDLRIQYPVLEYPEKVRSLNPDKTPVIEGTLLGIKGQYLILDSGVLNVRSFSGYQMVVEGVADESGVRADLDSGLSSGGATPAFAWPQPEDFARTGPYGSW